MDQRFDWITLFGLKLSSIAVKPYEFLEFVYYHVLQSGGIPCIMGVLNEGLVFYAQVCHYLMVKVSLRGLILLEQGLDYHPEIALETGQVLILLHIFVDLLLHPWTKRWDLVLQLNSHLGGGCSGLLCSPSSNLSLWVLTIFIHSRVWTPQASHFSLRPDILKHQLR